MTTIEENESLAVKPETITLAESSTYSEVPTQADVYRAPERFSQPQTLILIHGQASNAETDWSDLIAQFVENGFNTVAITTSRKLTFNAYMGSLPAGQAPDFDAWSHDAMGKKDFAAELSEVEAAARAGITKLGNRAGTINVMGHSLGGTLAVELASQFRDMVKGKVVLVAPSAIVDEAGSPRKVRSSPMVGESAPDADTLQAHCRELGSRAYVFFGQNDDGIGENNRAVFRDAHMLGEVLKDVGHGMANPNLNFLPGEPQGELRAAKRKELFAKAIAHLSR